jgi:hypothetical protein
MPGTSCAKGLVPFVNGQWSVFLALKAIDYDLDCFQQSK